MADTTAIPLKRMINAQLALLVHGDVKTNERDYRGSWPEEVNPVPSYRERFPHVVPVDRDIRLEVIADRADIAFETAPSVFADIPAVIEKTAQFHRYVIYVHDGHKRFGKGSREKVATMPPDELPLTLREGMFAVFHHGRLHGWRHGLICAGSYDARGRHPVIAATSRGFLLTAVRPESRLFRFAVARRGSIIPASV